MARRPRMAGVDPFADLAKKVEILEREMATQRLAIERLKALGSTPSLRPPVGHGRGRDASPRRTA
jgi:hypothetical protein